MANLARFIISGSPSTAKGFDANPSQVLSLQLEAPSGTVQRTTFQVYDAAEPTASLASKNAPALTLVGATSGKMVDATTPAAAVTCAMPASGVHAWKFRCLVNGGLNAKGKADPDYIFERIVVIRSGTNQRKVIATERTEYSDGGWADALNDFFEAGFAAAALGAGTEVGQTYTWNGTIWVKERGFIRPQVDYTGVVDATATLQTLFASARKGACIKFSDGEVRVGTSGVAGPASIFAPTNGVTVMGSERGHDMGSRVYSPGNADIGTRLKVYGTGRLFSPTQQVTIAHFEIHYPDQAINAAPAVYDYTFFVGPNWHGCTIHHIVCTNPYRFFYLNANGFTMHDVQAYPLARGITLARVADVARFDKVHFTPNLGYEFGLTLHDWVNNNAVMWLIDGAEQWNATDCFGVNAAVGILFDDEDTDNFQGSYGSWKGGGLEGVKVGIQVSNRATRALPANGFRMMQAEIVPSNYGVLFSDTYAAVQPGERPGIELAQVGIHSAGVHQYAVGFVPNSRGKLVWNGGLMQPSANTVEILKNSTQAFLALNMVESYSGRTRIGGTGAASNVTDQAAQVLTAV